MLRVFVTREMQSKPQGSVTLTPVGVTLFKGQEITAAGEDAETREPSYTVGGFH